MRNGGNATVSTLRFPRPACLNPRRSFQSAGNLSSERDFASDSCPPSAGFAEMGTAVKAQLRIKHACPDRSNSVGQPAVDHPAVQHRELRRRPRWQRDSLNRQSSCPRATAKAGRLREPESPIFGWQARGTSLCRWGGGSQDRPSAARTRQGGDYEVKSQPQRRLALDLPPNQEPTKCLGRAGSLAERTFVRTAVPETAITFSG